MNPPNQKHTRCILPLFRFITKIIFILLLILHLPQECAFAQLSSALRILPAAFECIRNNTRIIESPSRFETIHNEIGNQVIDRYSTTLNQLNDHSRVLIENGIRNDIAVFSNNNEYRMAFDEMSPPLNSIYEEIDMNQAEAATGRYYTSGSQINEDLKAASKNSDLWNSELRGYKYLLDEALEKLPEVKEDKILYRGIKTYDAQGDWEIGQIVEYPHNLSTSLNREVALQFAEINGSETIFEVSNPKGAKVIPDWLTYYPEESEVVIKAPSKFIVTDVFFDEEMKTYVVRLNQLESVEAEPDFFSYSYELQSAKTIVNAISPISIVNVRQISVMKNFNVLDLTVDLIEK